MRVLVAVIIGLTLAGCSSAAPVEPKVVPTTASAFPTPSASAKREAAPPVVVGDIAIRDTSPETLAAQRTAVPMALTIDAFDIDMPVMAVGIESDGQMEVPESAAVAGWYRFGPVPGSAQGNAVIAAHVDDSEMGLGPFSRLRDMEVGMELGVAMEDGTDVTYVVEAVEQTDKQVVDMDLVFQRDGEHQMVLVTCGGRWDRDVGHYDDNVVVYATRTDAPAR